MGVDIGTMTPLCPRSMGWSAADIPNQQGRVALITGANSGLGLETARALKLCGATVVLACRSPRKAELAKQNLLQDRDGGAVDLLDLDLADLTSVERAAATVGERYGCLDLLINNAGVMAPPRRSTAQGHELQFGVNHLGHMALTQALLPLMQNRPDPRVVTVTSGAQYFGKIRWDDPSWSKGYDRYGAYGQSKLANVMFALELDARLREAGQPHPLPGCPSGHRPHRTATHRNRQRRQPLRGPGLPADGSPVSKRQHGCPAATACRHRRFGAGWRALRP